MLYETFVLIATFGVIGAYLTLYTWAVFNQPPWVPGLLLAVMVAIGVAFTLVGSGSTEDTAS